MVQNDHSLFGILKMANIFPAITFFICVNALIFTIIDKKFNLQIQNKLVDQRKEFEYN
jgi:Na+/melibiose symporter-like transporter